MGSRKLKAVRPINFEERENLCRLHKKTGGGEFLGFIHHLIDGEEELSTEQLLSIYYHCPAKTDLSEDKIKNLLNILRDQGIEVAPEDFIYEIELIMHQIRLTLADEGHEDIPDSDTELINKFKMAV